MQEAIQGLDKWSHFWDRAIFSLYQLEKVQHLENFAAISGPIEVYFPVENFGSLKIEIFVEDLWNQVSTLIQESVENRANEGAEGDGEGEYDPE